MGPLLSDDVPGAYRPAASPSKPAPKWEKSSSLNAPTAFGIYKEMDNIKGRARQISIVWDDACRKSSGSEYKVSEFQDSFEIVLDFKA